MSGRGARLALAAWEGVRAMGLRSVLAALGLTVGVAAVCLVVAAARGSAEQVTGQVQALGSNLLTVRAAKLVPKGSHAASGEELTSLTLADARALTRMEGVLAAVPMVVKTWRAGLGPALADTVAVSAPPAIFKVEGQAAARGRLFTPAEERERARVAVLGPSLSRNLAGGASLVGRRITINRQPFLVVGELSPKGVDPTGQDLDDRVYLPLSTALSRLLGGRLYVDQVTLQAGSLAELPELARAVGALLRKRHRLAPDARNDFYISTQIETLAAQRESSRLFGALTLGVASLGLVVAGIGVMAVMLIGVRERSAEIGVRRAVGARRRDVRLQFLLEAALLGLGGSLPGAGLGLGLSAALERFGFMAMVPSPDAAGAAVAVGLAITLCFGLWPAGRAAALPPAQAVRLS